MLRPVLALLALLAAAGFSGAEPAAPLGALAKMPVKELTVFKDGHAFVVHQGAMPTDAAGNVVMDYLPTPVLGTFWPYCHDKRATLKAVTAGRRRVRIERTAMTLRDLIEANPGAEVLVAEGASPLTRRRSCASSPVRPRNSTRPCRRVNICRSRAISSC